ncbi:MAG: membrane protein insertion efficiency factor YidD [Candidatus Pacebacteria bacterium]|nr:membrane protein insertion efficiency factor YidD [Candidatus Paceibacterota bacterium]
MVIYIIRLYQLLLSLKRNLLVSVFGYASYCKHRPSCSEYTLREVKKHGTILGLWRGFKRVITCY